MLYNIRRQGKLIIITFLPSRDGQEISKQSILKNTTYGGDETSFFEPMRQFKYGWLIRPQEGFIQIQITLKKQRDLSEEEENLILSYGKVRTETIFRTVEKEVRLVKEIAA